jgi:hypothetical protein
MSIFKWAFLLIGGLFLAGCCQKTIAIYSQPVKKISVTERPATMAHPAQFYLCGNAEYPCRVRSHHHTASLPYYHQQKRNAHEKSTAKQTCIFE